MPMYNMPCRICNDEAWPDSPAVSQHIYLDSSQQLEYLETHACVPGVAKRHEEFTNHQIASFRTRTVEVLCTLQYRRLVLGCRKSHAHVHGGCWFCEKRILPSGETRPLPIHFMVLSYS